MKSDWSKISTDDLITIIGVFDGRIENEDGSCEIHLIPFAWRSCQRVLYEIGHELHKRAQEP